MRNVGTDEPEAPSSTWIVEDTWLRAADHVHRSSEHFLDSVLEANQAMMAMFGGTTTTDTETERLDSPTAEVSYARPTWSVERSAETRAELGPGEYVEFTKQIVDEDVRSFAEISGDTNRLHLEDAFAQRTRFSGRIAHGTLVSGLISAALARLPGLTIYLSQDLDFLAPAEIDGTLTAVCEITEDIGDDKYRLDTKVRTSEDTTLVDGEAIVLIDDDPTDDDR